MTDIKAIKSKIKSIKMTEKDKVIEGRDKIIEVKNKIIEEKDRIIEKKDRLITALKRKTGVSNMVDIIFSQAEEIRTLKEELEKYSPSSSMAREVFIIIGATLGIMALVFVFYGIMFALGW